MPATTTVLLEALGRGIPRDRLIVDEDVLASLSHDEAEWAAVGRAAVGLRARSEAEVQHAVSVCAELGVAVVARGAGTGLSGGANATDGCVIVDLTKMDKVVDVDCENLLAVVQPGVVNNDLKAAVAEHGLWYPPDPASAPISTIGGNVATNAGGLCCLKYGVTRDYVLGMRAVVGGPAGYGTAVRLGRKTNKGVAGYDIAGLMVGSEGTLGVVTEVTLRLRPALVGTPRTVVGAFEQPRRRRPRRCPGDPPRAHAIGARAARPRAASRPSRIGSTSGSRPTRPPSSSPGSTRSAMRAKRRLACWPRASSSRARCGRTSRPTTSRRKHSSRRGGSPTPRSNG